MKTEERIERELICVDYLFKRVDAALDNGDYKEALGYVDSIRYSIDELIKLDERKKNEEHFINLLKRNGVQIHHVLHVMQIKK